MATGGGGGVPDGGGGSPERQGGSCAEGGRHRFRQPCFDIAAIDVDSEEDREARPERASEQGCSQLALASQCSSDPLRHYICDDGEELWELYIQFDGAKFWSTTARRSEIRWLYLLGLMEKNGYGLCDSMYYVKEEGEGLNGLELKKQSELAWKWLSNIPAHTWARWAFDTNCKTDLVNNNLSEVFNRYILDERNKPIVTMLVGIYDRQMVRFDEKREGGNKSLWEITPHYGERLELMKKYARNCVPRRADDGLWQVASGETTYEVNIDKRTCSCRKWDLSGLPCNHAVSAIYRANKYPEDLVSDFYKKPMYRKAYRPVFYPMPQQHGWTKTDTEDIMPPDFKDNLKGRRQEKRRKGKFEVPKPKETSRMATITCSNCKLQGHKYTSCAQPLKPDLAFRKSQHKSNRTVPHGAGPSGDGAASSSSQAAPPVTEPSAAAPRPRRSSFVAPRSTHDVQAPTTASASGSTAPRRAAMGYFTAGANAGPGRDKNVGPLDG